MHTSVIIPCYNAEKYIKECVLSVTGQEFSDFELICVDDASTDSTPEILAGLAAGDSRISVIRKECNSGSARPTIDEGLKAASGEFVCIIGNDDIIAPDFLRKLADRQKETGADMTLGRMCMFYDDAPDMPAPAVPEEGFDFSAVPDGKQAVMMTVGGWRIGANGALVRRSLILSQRSRTPVLNHMNADEFDTRELLLMSGRVAFTDAAYRYRSHSGSITKISSRRHEALITDSMIAALFREHFGRYSRETRLVTGENVMNIRSVWKQEENHNDSVLKVISDCESALSPLDIMLCKAPFGVRLSHIINLRRKLWKKTR